MNKEDFVSYEIAVKLRGLGFNEPCAAQYSFNELLYPKMYKDNDPFIIKAPTWGQLKGWFTNIMSEPIQIETDEWWYKGWIIQKQNHPKLLPFWIFPDNDEENGMHKVFISFEECTSYIDKNPYENFKHTPIDYL